MTQYLISFDDGAMTFPEEELPDVAKAAQEVVQEARDAGVWVFSGGLESQRASVVGTDGTVTDGPRERGPPGRRRGPGSCGPCAEHGPNSQAALPLDLGGRPAS